PGVDGTVYVMTSWDPDGAGSQPEVVVVGGSFSLAGSVLANNIACWNPTSQTWSTLGEGLDGWVYALAVLEGKLYVGGYFGTASGVVATSGLASWDPTTQTWSAVGGGLGTGTTTLPSATALTALDGKLYVAGSFTTAGPVSAASIARWDPATSTWSALGAGVSGTVYALTGLNGKLYAGGEFSTLAPVLIIKFVACWDPATSTWSSLGTGVGGVEYPCVWSLADLDGKLYVGGDFTTAGGDAANYLASWDPTTQTWAAAGSEDTPVRALVVGEGKLYAIHVACQGPITSWDPATSTWASVAGELEGGTAYSAVALTVLDCKLCAGSDFTTAGELNATGVACWDLAASGWSALGSGIDGPALAMTALDGRLYTGGRFTIVGGVSASRVASWDPATSTFSPLWVGIDGTYPQVSALTALNGKVYAGGKFTYAGVVIANHIACWNPVTSGWTALGTGIDGPYPEVSALAALNDKLYVGGSFTSAGGVSANNVAGWDPVMATWSALDTGTDDGVTALAVLNGKLYAGGHFTTAGGTNAQAIACWDPIGQAWSPVGGPLSSGSTYSLPSVNALAALDGKLYMAGEFTIAGGVSAKNIACWDPTTSAWSALGSGVDEDVYALTAFDGKLYVAGWFATAGGVDAASTAYWDPATQTWSALGAGTDESVEALVALDDTLYAGGHFATAGGQVSAYWARARQDPPSVPADLDRDCNVDSDDLTIFAACASGPVVPYDPNDLPDGCTLVPDHQGIIAADLDGDNDVDQSDFGIFQRCLTGALPADPDCSH
ncbi:MAG: hypothetical protein HY718_02480, partial [Planctomycetes bacterium]|nr:hypothetical protein [Planctomycetota bacterium]